MAKDIDYVNGVISAKEIFLLGGKIYKLCELSAEDAFRAVAESGFGKGAEVASVYEYENLLLADERDLDAFIREYAPAKAESAYLLAPRDFHNAKAVLKAYFLNTDVDKMLAPEGLLSVEEITRCIKEEDLTPLGKELKEAVESSSALFNEENADGVSGAKIGAIFEKALYKYLLNACSKNLMLKKLIVKKIDMTNILTFLRSKTCEYATENFIQGGKLKIEQLNGVFSENAEESERLLDNTEYKDFYATCIGDKSKGLPFTKAELIRDDLEIDFLAERKYELKRAQPFLYYVLRRRAENENLRILFVCLLAGMSESDIKKRLRAI